MIFSFVMFCIQLNTATLNLMNPPFVDSTYKRKITSADFPMINLCPEYQMNPKRFDELGYFSLLDFLHGKNQLCNGNNSCTSWGADKNLTFLDVQKSLYDRHILSGLSTLPEIRRKIVFIANFGFCFEISDIDNQTMEFVKKLWTHNKVQKQKEKFEANIYR